MRAEHIDRMMESKGTVYKVIPLSALPDWMYDSLIIYPSSLTPLYASWGKDDICFIHHAILPSSRIVLSMEA